MNPIKQIGRYQLPILNVVAIKMRVGVRGLYRRGYDVWLLNGVRIHFTEEEKAVYDDAINHHEQTMQVLGMAKGLGLRG